MFLFMSMSLLTVTGKFSVMIATLLYVLVHVHVTSNGNRKILGHDSNSSLCSWFMSLLTVTGKFSVMIATLLYVLVHVTSDGNRKILGHDSNSSLCSCSCERQSQPTKEMYIPLRPIPKETLCVIICIKWASNRNWQAEVLHT